MVELVVVDIGRGTIYKYNIFVLFIWFHLKIFLRVSLEFYMNGLFLDRCADRDLFCSVKADSL